MAQQTNPFQIKQPNGAGGLINNQVNALEPLKSIGGYDAAQRGLEAGTQTVEGRANNIIKSDSPLMQTARASSLRTANTRGLANSSMANQAGEMAVLNAAVPIASQDAMFANDVSNRNMDAVNRAGEFTASARNTGSLAHLQGQQQLGQIGAQGEQTRQNIGAQGLIEKELIGARGAQSLAEIGAQGSQQRMTAAQQADADKQLQGMRGQQATDLQTLQGQQQQALETQRGQIQQQLLTAEGAQKQQLLAQQAQIDKDLNAQKILADTNMQELRGTQALAEQGLRGEQALKVAAVEAQYKGLMQANDSASRVFSQVSASISEILIQPDIGVEQKQQLVNKQIELLEAGMAVVGGVAGVDLGGLLDFS